MKQPEYLNQALIADNATGADIVRELCGILHKLEDFAEKYPETYGYFCTPGMLDSNLADAKQALDAALEALE